MEVNGGGDEEAATQSPGLSCVQLNNNQHQPSDSSKKINAQCIADARLHYIFEQSGESGRHSFHYWNSIRSTMASYTTLSNHQMNAYFSKIQRGQCIQPFGCILVINESNFKVLAYSMNAKELLNLTDQPVLSLELGAIQPILNIGSDVRNLFIHPSSVLLEQAVRAEEITLLNPLWLHTSLSGKPFYGILHRIDEGIIIDLEPASTIHPALSIAGAVQSQKMAVNAISELQTFPSGNIKLLCDWVVKHVQILTGYDRVMVYKFHRDEHGEIIAESKRDDLEPYLNFHYPANDIPQIARFLFKQNRVRMIVNCMAQPVKIVQDEELPKPLCLIDSTLRSPHDCHVHYMMNMGSIASLVMAIIVNNNEDSINRVIDRTTASPSLSHDPTKLWGLVVCHHTTPRSIPFPIRFSCEFLMQAFGLQLNMELQTAEQLIEKQVLKTQILLCDMLLRDSIIGIVSQKPSIVDVVKCDGAALFFEGIFYPLGVTPNESQIKEVIEWLHAFHGDSTGLSTDSLLDAGYPGATVFGNEVCGMAVAYLTSNDFLFWFRSHTAKSIKWGGQRHDPDNYDGQSMHPRSSFKTFLEVVKNKSLPWDTAEMDAIRSLQLILKDPFKNAEAIGDVNLNNIEDGVFQKVECLFGNIVNAAVRQVIVCLKDRKLQLMRDISEDINTMVVYVDQNKIQQMLAKFLMNIVKYAPKEGWVEIHIKPTLRQTESKQPLEVRMTCPGKGLPSELIQDMFHSSKWTTQEGLRLSICTKILKLMNGEVKYIRESEKCYFLIQLELLISLEK